MGDGRDSAAVLAVVSAGHQPKPHHAAHQARADTAEDDAFSEVSAWLAPLTLSADGLWRLHVDGRNVLHRVRLADPSQQARAGLPTPSAATPWT